jgi:hypothetical protein
MKLSASQISKGRRCLRLYAFEYVEGFKPPPSAKQQFGTDVHTHLENWLSKGIVPPDTPEGNVAKQGIQKGWLPVPSDKLLTEEKFDMPWIDDVNMMGYIDCVEPPGLVIDHKTTSSLNWAKTEEQLALDEQAIIYAIWAAQTFNVSVVNARWIYYAASNPKTGARKPAGSKAIQTSFDFTSRFVQKAVKDLLSFSKQLIWIRKNEIKAACVPPNPHACGAFGGCPHKERCGLSEGDRLAAYFDKERF